MPLPVIPALFKEMADTRRAKRRTKVSVAEACNVSERTVERWESLESLPLRKNEDDPGGDLARAVDGYAKVTETTPFELWDAALKRAKRERKAYEASLKLSPKGPSSRSRRAASEIDQQTKS